MEGFDVVWQPLHAAMQTPAFQKLGIDCIAVGASTLDGPAVQIADILFLQGDIHEAPEVLRSHCASLISVWSSVQAPTQIDLDECACVGRRLLLQQARQGRRFAIHATPISATQLLFVVFSSINRWTEADDVKALLIDLTKQAQHLHAMRPHEHTSVAPESGDSGFDWYLFTSREIEILKLIAGGLSNKQIARELHCSPNTIRNHIYAVFRKAGVSNRTELALQVSAAS